MVNAEYQWTRVLGTENIENPSGATPRDSYGPISGVTPQVLNLNYTYLLPVGKGQLLFNNANSLVNRIIGGWQWSGMATFQTGQPFSVSSGVPSHTVGVSSIRANVVPGVSLYPNHKTRAEWFNPAAFSAPAAYTGANGLSYASFGTSSYDMLRGPGWWDTDMNLVKNISWADHYNLQLRADSFNIFNHPNFTIPNASVTSPSSVGTITATSATPVYEQRTIEFGAKFNF
jgi:hypothetical protein